MAEERERDEGRLAEEHDQGGEDVGPDPVWGVSVGIVGLLIMGTAGALTWHYVFNVGEAIMLLGAVMFLYSVTRSTLMRSPIGIRERLPSWLGGPDDEDE
jgi:hypothetical protein